VTLLANSEWERSQTEEIEPAIFEREIRLKLKTVSLHRNDESNGIAANVLRNDSAGSAGSASAALGGVARSGYVEGVLRETNRQMSANPYIKDVMIDCQAEQGGGLFNRIAQMTL
jgi:hypothetical protein